VGLTRLSATHSILAGAFLCLSVSLASYSQSAIDRNDPTEAQKETP